MRLDLAGLFCRHAVASFGKQLHLADLVGTFDWHFDLRAGLLSFQDEYRWHAQILGTESEQAGTWLWAWANPSSGITPEVLHASLTLKELGQKEGIEELTQAQVALGEITGHYLALIASGACRADAYYRGTYNGGAAFLLIQDDSFPADPMPPLARLATAFPQAVSSIDIPDHKQAMLGYLDYYGLNGKTKGNTVVVEDSGKPVLTAKFDKQHRLRNLEARVVK
jgi:hypothetical protein